MSAVNSQWFTPAPILDRARAVLGPIDLDPASCKAANEQVGAQEFLWADGLAIQWSPDLYTTLASADGETIHVEQPRRPLTIWLNPPSPALPWWAKLMGERDRGRLAHAIFLAFNVELLQTSQGRRRYPPLAAFPLCAPAKRIRFVRPDGKPGKSPRHSSLIVYVPGTVDRRWAFADAFADFGAVLLPGSTVAP